MSQPAGHLLVAGNRQLVPCSEVLPSRIAPTIALLLLSAVPASRRFLEPIFLLRLGFGIHYLVSCILVCTIRAGPAGKDISYDRLGYWASDGEKWVHVDSGGASRTGTPLASWLGARPKCEPICLARLKRPGANTCGSIASSRELCRRNHFEVISVNVYRGRRAPKSAYWGVRPYCSIEAPKKHSKAGLAVDSRRYLSGRIKAC